jgi:tetratricopeptide (TPR) repeat protein
MTESLDANVVNLPLERIVAKVIGRRLAWLFILPFAITIILVAMFFVLSKRLTEIEVGARLVTIEQNLAFDKNYPSAIAQYEELAATNSSASILARLASLYFQADPEKNVDIALQKLALARRIDPKYSEIYRTLTYIYVMTKQWDHAIESGRTAIQQNPYDAATYNNLAWLYATAGGAFTDLNLALQYAQKAVDLTKDKQVSVLDTLATIYFKLGDNENALATFHKAKASALGDMQRLQDHFKLLYPNETL